jgi:hypothetical protein
MPELAVGPRHLVPGSGRSFPFVAVWSTASWAYVRVSWCTTAQGMWCKDDDIISKKEEISPTYSCLLESPALVGVAFHNLCTC